MTILCNVFKPLNKLVANNFTWFPEIGVGFLNAEPIVYGKAYFEKYVRYEKTELGQRLNQFRIDLVNKYSDGNVIDFGCGCGTFIKARGRVVTQGYEIISEAIDWLQENHIFFDPYEFVEGKRRYIASMSFFDSFEHIENFENAICYVNNYVFISMPIYRNAEHVLTSKHYRPGEHFWYFTEDGLKHVMQGNGFHCVEISGVESELGREDILTFVFARTKKHEQA